MIDAVTRWSSHNERFRHDGKPDRNTEYLFYQTLVGAWPLEPERARAYMLKAVREAKRETSWTRPDEHYEAAVLSFVERALVDHEFMSDVEHFVGPVIAAGRINSLSQTLLKLTVPGVPDIYQGAELWDTSLVDPDNRRLVDYTKRRELLHSLAGASVARVLERMAEGLPKLLVVQRALALRRRRPEQFGSSAQYQPLFAAGSRAEHVVSFLRGDAIAVVVPRWSALLRGDWRDTELELPAHGYRNVLTGEHQLGGKQRLARLLSAFPVCLLERE